jgi:hypothetical protein
VWSAMSLAIRPQLPRPVVGKAGPMSNSFVDALILGGLSIGLFVLMRFGAQIHNGTGLPNITPWAGWSWIWINAVWVINWPHFAATSMRLYSDRSALKKFPITTIVLPLIVVALTIAALFTPTTLAPAMVKLYLTWSPYHFSGQTVGIALLMARRKNFHIGRLDRVLLWTYVVTTFAMQNARSEVGDWSQSFYGVTYRPIGLSPIVPDVLWWVLVLSGAALVVRLIVRMVIERRIAPPVVVIPVVAQTLWFLHANVLDYSYMVPMFHSAQYLLIAFVVHLDSRAKGPKAYRSRLRFTGEMVAWYSVAIVGGIVLFKVLPWTAEQFATTAGVGTAVVLAGVQLHHFVVDGVIWKLSGTGASAAKASIPQLWRRSK